MSKEEVVVEAVELKKLFPVMGGFFESLFSPESMKMSWQVTKKYFSDLFSKGGFKNYGKLTKEYFSNVFATGEERYVHAVDGVTFKIHRGETFGLVGESGCGKSTTGLLLLHLLDKTSGEMYFKGTEISTLTKRQLKNIRSYKETIKEHSNRNSDCLPKSI
jgi:ABC-type glutathione transport system ATPase component